MFSLFPFKKVNIKIREAAEQKNSFLDLSGNLLGTIPKSVFELQHISTFNFSNNKLENIPEGLFSMRNLTCLNLSENYFKTIPDSICNLENLEELILDKTNISTIPDSIINLKKLKKISLKNCQFEVFPYCLFNLTNISEIRFDKNCINEFIVSPSQLEALRKLKVFKCSSYYISKISPEVEELNFKELFFAGKICGSQNMRLFTSINHIKGKFSSFSNRKMIFYELLHKPARLLEKFEGFEKGTIGDIGSLNPYVGYAIFDAKVEIPVTFPRKNADEIVLGVPYEIIEFIDYLP